MALRASASASIGLRLDEQHNASAQLLQGLARDRRMTSPLVQWLGGPRLTTGVNRNGRPRAPPTDADVVVSDLGELLTHNP